MKIIIVGGAGYIGSHAAHYFKEQGCDIVILDDLSTGHSSFATPFQFCEGNLGDLAFTQKVFQDHRPTALLHFAANCLVEESEKDPLKYYRNNVVNSINLFETAIQSGCKQIIFSSTAAVYGNPKKIPVSENSPKSPINTYGRTKLMIEQTLQDLGDKGLCQYAIFRYFNAAGCSSKYPIGEIHDPETHLIPNILKAASSGKPVSLFGTDYPTLDGTCVRDYIHVDDLAQAHYLGFQYLQNHNENLILNLGSHRGYSIKEVIETAKAVTQKTIPVEEKPRRAGDPPVLIADSSQAKKVLGWVPKNNLTDIVTSAWNWHQKSF